MTAALLWILACHPDEAPVDDLTLLSPREQLIRVSVDLRGVHPSEMDLAAVEAHPELYEGFVDRYLGDPRFLGRIRELFNLRFLTRTGETYFDLSDVGVTDDAAAADAIADEPLRLLTKIVDEERPYTEMVTADYTMADPLLQRIWDLEPIADEAPDADGWQPSRYTDGRPMAGMLTMSSIWARYGSMGGNANRHRANAVSRMLLCDDYLSRPIVLNRAAVDLLTVDPETAIATTDTCQSCHSTLDPLAGNFFGFFHYDANDDLRSATTYLPEAEKGWMDYSGRAPGYFGRPTANLYELGEQIAEDPRFTDCAVRSVWEGLHQREETDADWTDIATHRDAFTASGDRIRPLVRSIVLSRPYRAAKSANEDEDARLATLRIVSPGQLASVVEGITGYRWTFDGRDGLTTQDRGLPVLAGGIDGMYTTTPASDPTLGLVFVQERLAQSAAAAVVAHDLAEGREGDAKLLAYVTAASTPETDPEAFDAQIRDLYLRVTGIPLADDATEPARLVTLWKQLYSLDGSAESAWTGVVSAVLRDPRVLFY